MDIFDHPYYKVNKRLLVLIGQWPYQNSYDRFFRRCFVNFIFTGFAITQIALVSTCNGNIDVILESVPFICVFIAMVIKYYTYQIQRNNMQYLLKHIVKNWQIWETREEMNIMHEFAGEGRFFTLVYITYIYICMIFFLILPFFPRLMDIIVPLNESRPLRSIIKSYYFVDGNEYFYSIYCHMSIEITVGITVLIASDSLFLVFNSHICGLFSAVGFRLEHLLFNRIDSEILLDRQIRKLCIDNFVHSIKNHKRALEFAELIESSYSISFLIQAFLGLICLSISMFLILMSLDKPPEALTFLIFACAQFLHLLCICYPGQRMIDYSTDIRIKAYNGLWYEAPIEIHRLVLLIIRRSMEPCYLTAGKTFIFCLETFSKILQTSGSYFMNALRPRNVMDTFDHPYYKVNKRLLMMVGQWPYQNSYDRFFGRCIVNFIFIVFTITQVALICTCNGNIDIILESIPFICGFIAMVIKYYSYQVQRNKIRILLKHVVNNWQILKTREEMDIMHKFAGEGRFITFVYIIYIYTCMIMFLITPLLPRLMDVILPLNESRPLRSVIRGYYFIDEKEYFYAIYCHMCIEITIAITVLIATDSLFLVFNSHICGLFAIVGFRLEHLLHDQIDSKILLDNQKRKMVFNNVVHTIKNHKRALEFAELIESCYSIPFLVQSFLGLICLSVSMFLVLMLLDKRAEAFRFIAFSSAQFLHLLCICYPGQRMIDYSTDIHIKAYNGLWYEAPIEIHRLVLLIIRRSMEPCYLTAGKIFIFCLETFSKNALRFRNVMDSFEHHYYKFNKRLLVLIGQWPYQNSIDCFFRRCIVNFIFIIFVITQVALILTCNGNIDMILETTPSICGFIIIAIKYYTYQIQRNDVSFLLINLIAKKITIAITLLIATDSLFLVFNSHICGLFAIVGFRLEHLLHDQIDSKILLDNQKKKMIFNNVVHTIKNHKRALKFAELIESCYSVSFLMQSCVGLICLSVSMFQILMLLDKISEAFRFFAYSCAQFVHLLCICYPGQRMIDYSTDIRTKAYNGLWYKAPIEIHRLVLLIIRRSMEPCYLTAGKTFIFCLETFAKILQTSGSYLMMSKESTKEIIMHNVCNILREENYGLSESYTFIVTSIACAMSMNQPVNMNIFEGGFYKCNYLLLYFLGLWPYQKSRSWRFYLVNIMLLSFNLPQFLKLYTSKEDIDVILKVIPVWGTSMNAIIKYYTIHLSPCNMKTLLDDIIIDWKIWNTEKDIEIMTKYAKEGRLYSLIYAVYAYFTSIVFLGVIFVPRMMDIIQPLNESRPLKLPIICEYFLDQDKYFYPIYFHVFISLLISVTVLIAADIQLMIFTYHVCSAFAVIGYRLEDFLKDAYVIKNWTNDQRKRYRENLVFSINGHRRAIEFANYIESSFSYSLLLQSGINIICMSISLYRINKEMGKRFDEVLRYVLFVIGQLFHMFYTSYAGQMIIDHSTNIGGKAYNSMWYEAPKEINKLLLLIMKRSVEQSNLTAGKIFIFCIESFGTIFQLYTSKGDFNMIIEIVPTIATMINMMIKYYTYYIGMFNIRKLLDKMIIDWKIWNTKEEIEIIKRYAEEGRLYTLAYTIYIYVSTVLYLSISFLPLLLDVILPLNVSRPLQPIVLGEYYFIDQSEHFYFIFCHMALTILLAMTIVIATDTQFFVFTSHACGVFSVVGFRFERLMKSNEITFMINEKNKYFNYRESLNYVACSIEGHSRAIEFANLIESSFSIPLLIQCGVNVACLSVSLYRMTMLLDMSTETFKYIAFLAAQLFHIFCICYSGQRIIDYSSEIFLKAYNGLWYEAPLEIRKLLLLVIRRGIKPSKLTGGNIFVFCLKGFSTIVHTSTSYFMFLSSMN
ncbi:uncharacterized protein LOC124955263 [Vespa velutina]|uniref:uncharacterized protein LOC124955263 n=1 Tax=Vespa velutina TaxID=202808 RepID=UPI001FB4D5C4|nr:uncharacterized protein LOC124955263 [Vespa velutina]